MGLAGQMVGDSEVMKEVRRIIARVAPTDARVMITGESGTGKELVASAIHEGSERRDKPFIRVNCAAIPRDLVESEMFGHERGAFTGATQTRVGRFELAHKGTLFLDEVGDLGAEAQAKLLRAIEAQEIQRVGGNKVIRTDVRIVSATNHDLLASVKSGAFREDLYFRLNVIPLALPPLRDRPGDIIPLVHHFSAQFFKRTGRPSPLWRDDALAMMREYSWPGNVRELANVVERLAILHPGTEISSRELNEVLPREGSVPKAAHPPLPDASADERRPLVDALDSYERNVIRRALSDAKGNIAEAARRLQTDRPNLYRRMRRLGIDASGVQ
jgi:transcriptional regulator with GAF, ATPase, and Fis domain